VQTETSNSSREPQDDVDCETEDESETNEDRRRILLHSVTQEEELDSLRNTRNQQGVMTCGPSLHSGFELASRKKPPIEIDLTLDDEPYPSRTPSDDLRITKPSVDVAQPRSWTCLVCTL